VRRHAPVGGRLRVADRRRAEQAAVLHQRDRVADRVGAPRRVEVALCLRHPHRRHHRVLGARQLVLERRVGAGARELGAIEIDELETGGGVAPERAEELLGARAGHEVLGAAARHEEAVVVAYAVHDVGLEL
jgi:hypothetical protein